MKVTAISSSVGIGGVGLSAIEPLYKNLGYTLHAIPSIYFPSRPDIEPSIPQITSAGAIQESLLKSITLSDTFLLGYFANSDQMIKIAETLKALKKSQTTLITLDPVMGDDGRLYVKPDVVDAMTDKLLPLADILTPNRFEADILFEISGLEFEQAQIKFDQIFEQKIRPIIIITSAKISADEIEIWFWNQQGVGQKYHHKKLDNPPRGTGDCFSGLVALYAAKGEQLSNIVSCASTIVLDLIETAQKSDASDQPIYLDQVIESLSVPLNI